MKYGSRWVLGFALAAVVVAPAAQAAKIDFSLTHESDALKKRWKPGDQVPLGGYDAELGHVDTFSDQVWIVADPTCDFTSTLGMMMDASTQIVEVHGTHAEFEPLGPQDIEKFSTVIGAERNNVWGATFGALSGDSLTRLPLVQFGPDGFMYVDGKKTKVPYDNIFVGRAQCPQVDNRITLTWKMYAAAKELRIWLKTHGQNAKTYKFGPFPLPQQLIDEGFGRCYMSAPPLSGKYYWDGVVCNASSVVVDPTSNEGTGGRE